MSETKNQMGILMRKENYSTDQAKRNSLHGLCKLGGLGMDSLFFETFGMGAASLLGLVGEAHADEDLFKALFKEITGGIKPKEGRIVLETPRLADNGHSAAFRVYVDSPMTANDYVKSIYILSDRNPRPFVARFDLSPLNPRAEISTRVRLNGSQNVHALALTSKGEWFTAQVPVEVTESACLDAS